MGARLARAASPYLRQHADDPVDWWPWGPEAFAEARRRDVPVFLSIGYAACHWCHVMQRESFRDPATAALLDERFVCVKVDREEHPEVDALYMEALVALTGEGGWPASLWLRPDDLVPFQAGTYFPPFYRYGTPAFRDVCRRASEAWARERAGEGRGAIATATERVRRALAGEETPGGGRGAAGEETPLDAALSALARDWDEDEAGWGGGAKFPQVPRLALYLELGLGDRPALLAPLTRALDAMERGGIHDHVGGGFHRYAVDPDWATPHFEKMLDDNALLARLYARAWAATGRTHGRWLAVAGATVDFMLRDLGAGDGSFHSSLDAEAGGEEGEPYTWTPEQLVAAVGPARARAVGAAYGVGQGAPFEGGGWILRRQGDASVLAGARPALLAARGTRPQPAVDDKRIVAWNALACSALAEVGRLSGHPPWVAAAARLGDLLLAARLPDGSLPRLLGQRSPTTGTLADHAHLLEALLDLHLATGAPRWLAAATDLAAVLLDRFTAADGAGLQEAPRGRDDLFLHRAGWEDGAPPAPAGTALLQLVRLLALEPPGLSHERVQALADAARPALHRHPHGLPTALRARRRLARPPETVVVAGDEPAALLAPLQRRYLPGVEVVAAPAGGALPELGVLVGKDRTGPARAWRCEGTACGLPASTAEGVAGWFDG